MVRKTPAVRPGLRHRTMDEASLFNTGNRSQLVTGSLLIFGDCRRPISGQGDTLEQAKIELVISFRKAWAKLAEIE